MPDLTRGYPGNTAVVKAICDLVPVNLIVNPFFLARNLFQNNFMPYARTYWVGYDATYCNCEDLANALIATWVYFKGVKNMPQLPRAEKANCVEGDGMITNAIPVFGGPAHGNVRQQTTGGLDGRCLFPIHWLCKIGFEYFDPTFNRFTSTKDDCVERRLSKWSPNLWVANDGQRLYLRNLTPAPQFGDSWDEMDAAGWISAADWTNKTGRFGHTRSTDLKTLDQALAKFELDGRPALAALRTAFQNWATRNPKEASTRNFNNCVTGLAAFLGIPLVLRAGV
jgi:hypothetical protein